MKKTRSLRLSILFTFLSLAMFAKVSFSVHHLTCEQETNPLGIEKLQPRFSWQINAEERNFEQSAWQILVADTPEALNSDNGTVWNSQKVNSPASILVPFEGNGIKAGHTYFWKVRIWDKQGNVSPWSSVNRFHIGLLSEKDWSNAKWIALEKDKKDEKIEELTDRLTRQMAEFDNFRKRTEKEKSQMYEVGAKDIIEKILPVVDNFERGLDAVKEEDKEDPFVQGMEKVYKHLLTTLEGIEVKPIEAVGQPFDPNFHNAVMHVEDENFGENIVAEEFQKGYTYRDSVVRHSMVKVAN